MRLIPNLRHPGLDPGPAFFFKTGRPRIKSGVTMIERSGYRLKPVPTENPQAAAIS